MNDKEILLKGYFQKFDHINRNNGRIYAEEEFKKHLRDLDIEMKKQSRMRKIENILSDTK